MKKILVLSDTHYPRYEVPKKIWALAETADAVIHCGDFVTQAVYEDLKCLNKNIYGVFGNNDDAFLVSQLPEKRIIAIEGYQIGILHGFGFKYTKSALKNAIFGLGDCGCHCICFGHSHEPVAVYDKDILYFNPGTAAGARTGRQTVGLLTVSKMEGIKTEIIELC